MKRKLIKAGVFFVVFLFAAVVSSLVMNRGNDDAVVDMGAPTLPRVSFLVGGEKVNTLFGYTNEMEITAMRDTVTLLASDGSLSMNIEETDGDISGVRYEVYSMDGKEKYLEGSAEAPEGEEPYRLELTGAIGENVREAVLRVVLTVDGADVGYYTRIEKPDDLSAPQCLAFAKDFHSKAIEKTASEELESYLEPGEESDNTTYQTVNIHSDITHVQWGDLEPQVIGDVEWSYKEANDVYTSILATYQVSCQDENGESATYNIREFFRIRMGTDRAYLLNYNRDMQEVFSGGRTVLDDKGILLGIASTDVPYEVNEEGTMAAFVQERDLWLYDGEEDLLYQVFSFANREGRDERSRNDQHAVRIISMDESGNLTFAVYGYMNRGAHEGEVGVGIYYFSKETNSIEEKAFIPSTKSFAIAQDELGRMVYYAHDREMLYVLAAGTLYQIDLEKDEQMVLAEGLAEDQYAVSESGEQMAYQTMGSDDTSAVQVMNLKEGTTYTVEAENGETVCPLGFVNGDFIVGRMKAEDKGMLSSGEEITPMYKLEIRDSQNEKQAEYSFTDSGIYITDIVTEGNLVTVNRVVKNAEGYSVTAQEFITSNAERKESAVSVETYSTERMGKQVRLTWKDGMDNTSARVVKPNQLVTGEPLTITLSGMESGEKYYVYGMGELVAIYDKAGYAIQKAEQIAGVVISSSQAYVWEKGNRNLVYSTDAAAFQKEEGETSLQACERYMEQYGAEKVDLTGCTLDQVLYVINKGCPVIAFTDSSHAVLLTGYTKTDITYIDPDTGSTQTVGIGEMEQMVEAGGNTFIGYIKVN